MNIKKKNWASYRRITSKLKLLLSQGPVLEGTISKVNLKNSVRYQLTHKVEGRTKTVYIPFQAVAEVEDWVNRWKEVKNHLKELNDSSRSILPSVLASKTNPTTGCKKPLPSKVVRQQRSQTAAKCLKR